MPTRTTPRGPEPARQPAGEGGADDAAGAAEPDQEAEAAW